MARTVSYAAGINRFCRNTKIIFLFYFCLLFTRGQVRKHRFLHIYKWGMIMYIRGFQFVIQLFISTWSFIQYYKIYYPKEKKDESWTFKFDQSCLKYTLYILNMQLCSARLRFPYQSKIARFFLNVLYFKKINNMDLSER